MIVSELDIEIDFNQIQETACKSPSGCQSLFVKINDDIGLKLYRDHEDMYSCYNLQDTASKYGLGPKVYGTVEDISIKARQFQCRRENNTRPEREFICGYLTEVVQPCGDNYGAFDENLELFYDENIDTLTEGLQDIGISFGDSHPGNCGIDRAGNLVCIDFGEGL